MLPSSLELYRPQGSSLHGLGIFASQDLVKADFPALCLMGNFVVLDDVEVENAMRTDGVPRYAVCDGAEFKQILESYEVAREGAALYLTPDRTSPLFYMNSSCTLDAAKANMSKESRFTSHNVDCKSAKTLLSDAKEGVMFTISRDVQKGEELLLPYPIFSEDNGDGSDGGRAVNAASASSSVVAAAAAAARSPRRTGRRNSGAAEG